MRRLRLSIVSSIALPIATTIGFGGGAFAQIPNIQSPGMAVGQSPYATYSNPGDIDHVNPTNGNIYIAIPLLSYPQVGKDLRLQFNIYYNNKPWYIPNLALNPENNGTVTGGWSWYDFIRNADQIDTIGAYVARDQHLDFGQDDVDTSQTIGEQPTPCTYSTITFGFWVSGPDGSKHYYGDNSSQTSSGNGCNGDQSPYGLAGNIYPATDESGYTPANGSYVSGSTEMRDASGVLYTRNGLTGETVSDPNGNSIVSTASGWTDSVGHTLPGSTALPGFSNNLTPGGTDPVPGVPTSVGGTLCPGGTTSARDWAVPAQSGTTEHYYLCYSLFTYHTAFAVSSLIPSYQIFEATSSDQNRRPALLLSAVVLPNHTAYTFTYDEYLSLTELGLPTGGSISYAWRTELIGGDAATPVSRVLMTRTVNDANGNNAIWTYHYQLNETPNSSGGVSVTKPFYGIVTDPLQNDTEYQFASTDDAGNAAGPFDVDRMMQYNGCGPHDTFTDKTCSPAPGTLMKKESYVYTSIVSNAADLNTPGRGQGTLYKPTTTTTTIPVAGGNRITKTVTTLSPPYGAPCTFYNNFFGIEPLTTTTTTAPCSQFPQTASSATYAYGASGAGSLIRTDTTTYQWQTTSSYLTANLLNIPFTVIRTDGNGTPVAGTGYGYDESGSPSGARGNQTSVTRGFSGGNVVSRTVYNSQGMPIQTYDPKNHETTISYQCSGAFPENVVTPAGSTTTVVETTTYGYDCTTGEMTSKLDANNHLTTSYAYDDMRRLASVTNPDGGNTTTLYGDTSVPLTVTSTQTTGGVAGPIVNETQYDGLGRVIHKILMSDTSGQDYVDTTYDLLGRVKTVSNPHRPSNPVPTEDGTTTLTYDALGRKVQEQEADGTSTQQWCYGGITQNGVGNCHPNEAANSDYWVDHADETTRDWQQTTDSLGRISEALEPNSSNVPSLKTDYVYDVLDDLTLVLQHGVTGDTARGRNFVYDSLGRLTLACNPEALATGSACTSSGPWSQSYTYDADGNVHTRTDAKGVVTTYTYDDLDRVTAKNYSDGQTLNAYYFYDVNTCGDSSDSDVGHVTFSWTTTATTNLGPQQPGEVGVNCYRYDSMGRVRYYDTSLSVPGGPADSYGGGVYAQYDLTGNVKFVNSAANGAFDSAPVHTFDYLYDSAGRLSSITLAPQPDSLTNPDTSFEVPTSIATTIFQAVAKGSQPAYSAMGLEHAQLSVNTSGQPVMLYDHTFDKRGRPATTMYTTGAGAVGGAGSQVYSYSMGYLGNGSVSSAADSIVGTINIGNSGYDNLNRLTSLGYTGAAYGGINAVWTYDNFGNQLSQTLSGSSSTPVPGNTTTHYDAANHISFTSRTGNALPYDGNGNLTNDAQYAYAYDAENRLCAIKASGTYIIYVYNADGNRIAKGTVTPQGAPPPDVSICSPLKNSFSITQAYALGLNGEEIETYTPGESWHNTNVYNGNALIATYAGNYMSIPTTDWQGTRRAQIRNNQAVSGLTEFLSLPYGDGLTMVGGTSFDSLVQFTGKQYDQEDNLYNFDARYYGDWVGRFMSPDWSDGVDTVPSARWNDPQSLNLYSYGRNNPLSNVDPDGHDYIEVCGDGPSQSPCVRYTPSQWRGIIAGQNQQNANGVGGGITVTEQGPGGSGTINCGGVACGTATFHETGLQDDSAGFIMMAIPIERLAGPVIEGTGAILAKVFGGAVAKSATEGAELVVPKFADTPGGFVNWVRNLAHSGEQLTGDQISQIVAKGRQLGVDIRLDPPHPGTAWEVPHLNVGSQGQVHLRVPEGYANSSIPSGSARRP